MDNIIDNFKDVTLKWKDFQGRAARKEFWNYILALFVITITANVLDSMIFGHQNAGVFSSGIFAFAVFKASLFEALGPLGKLAAIILFVPTLAVAFRRLHDTGKSAWWLLIYIIPVIGWAIGVFFMVKDSDAENIYGPNPKQIT
jgi:uncharacterized membrane protein YhaH (DUF805 family)